MNKYIITFCFSTLIMSFSQIACADVSITINGSATSIKVSGIIKDGDEEQFRKYVSQFGSPTVIYLNSEGGSVDTAISIGRQIRQINDLPRTPWVVVNSDDKCLSSCVFILAGGLKRIVEKQGLVGIHRPFIIKDPNLSMEQQKIFYSNVEKKVKEYLEEVNVPTSLYDTMFRIPTDQIRYLSDKEMQDYNLNENDPYYHEANVAKSAEIYQMSKIEYLKFDNERTKECLDTFNLNDPEAGKKLADCMEKMEKIYKE